jgi:branched-chain amino acid transport system permease protein
MLRARDAPELRDHPDRAAAERGTVAARLLRAIRPTGSNSTLLRRLGWALLLLAAVFPWFGGAFYTRLAIEALLLGCVALSVDILLGYAGLLSLGQAAYFGLAAYIAALMYLHVTQSFWLVLLTVCGSVGIFSFILGAVAIRAKGVYFALITFGAAEILSKISHNTRAIGGSDGLIGIPIPAIPLVPGVEIGLTDNVVFYYLVLGAICLIYIGTRRILNTGFGSVLRAIRDNSDRVPYLGYNPFWYKLLAYVLAAQIAAFGGLIYPMLRGFVAPHLFGFEVSTKAVVMSLVGGVGTLIGPLMGSVIITFLESMVGSYTERHLIVLGAIFIVFVMFLPDGLCGLVQRTFGPRQKAGS